MNSVKSNASSKTDLISNRPISGNRSISPISTKGISPLLTSDRLERHNDYCKRLPDTRIDEFLRGVIDEQIRRGRIK